jgi:hypothetical protein
MWASAPRHRLSGAHIGGRALVRFARRPRHDGSRPVASPEPGLGCYP